MAKEAEIGAFVHPPPYWSIKNQDVSVGKSSVKIVITISVESGPHGPETEFTTAEVVVIQPLQSVMLTE